MADNHPQPNLSAQDLQAIVQAVMTEMLNNQAFANARNNNPPANNQPAVTQDSRWRIEEFGLFKPDLPVDDRHPAGDVITVGWDTIYRNVDAFAERIKDAITTKGAALVRDNLHLCLLGAATRWYTFEVGDLNKAAMRTDPTPALDQWISHLTVRFRPRMAQAVRENSELTYQVADVRAAKPILTYFQTKLLRSRVAGFNSVHAQLIQIYMGLDAVLRRNLFEPTTATTIDQYRELLVEKEEVWMEIYRQRLRNSRNQPSTQQTRSYTSNPLLLSPVRTLTNRPQVQNSTPSPGSRQTAVQQPYQINSPPNARLPCPFHTARGQTYYRSPLACKLPEAKALLSGDTSNRIQQINFQA